MSFPLIEGTPAVSAVLTDITESKQAIAALHKLEQLATAGRMAAQVAHEIERIARQTFDMSRPDNEEELQPLARIIDDVTSLQGIASEKQDVRIEAEVEPQCAHIHLPGHPLRQILYNLVRNALDLSQEGGVVRIAAMPVPQRCVHISVIDHGPGIPEDIQPHIFKPFFTTKTGTRTSGMGLGLSICHDLVTHLGGTLTFKTEPGRGTSFTVSLPHDNRPCRESATYETVE